MKILIISLLKRKVTAEVTASRPRIIYELCNGLIKKGHEITILGTGDSFVPGAKIIPIIPKAFVDLPGFENPFYAETAYLVMLAKKIQEIHADFDVIHNHTYPEFINLLTAEKLQTPFVTTIHSQATPELDQVLSLFPNTHLIAISQTHKKLFQRAKIDKVVYNGVDTHLYKLKIKTPRDGFLLWLGRLSKAKNQDATFMDPKGVKWAIRLARETGEKLVLSGNVEDMNFYNSEVKPYLNDNIRWHGPVSSEQLLTKQEVVDLMQQAKAFLMTINWYEPFGLVMAEAGSCGTPVIGFDRGSLSEVVIHGKTGFIVPPEKGIEGLKEALTNINQIKPEDCRKHVEENFSVEKMVGSYESTYKQIIDKLHEKN